jgi:hypothetical protein
MPHDTIAMKLLHGDGELFQQICLRMKIWGIIVLFKCIIFCVEGDVKRNCTFRWNYVIHGKMKKYLLWKNCRYTQKFGKKSTPKPYKVNREI